MTASIGRREFITVLRGGGGVAARGPRAAAADAGDRRAARGIARGHGVLINVGS